MRCNVVQVVDDGVLIGLNALSAEEAQADCNGDTDNDNAEDDEEQLLLSH
jgi:hypothetical protein